MIQNIVFDMVGVLMRFDTDGYCRAHGIGEADREVLRREVFHAPEWTMQDLGAISEADAAAAIRARLPERLHVAARDFVCREGRAILPVPGMETLLSELKGAGYRLFLLSNISAAYHRFRPQVPGIERFDGELVSADVGLVKPDPAIFRLACERFGIDPSESAFIDDTPANAEAARGVGMMAFVFDGDTDALRARLIAAGVTL